MPWLDIGNGTVAHICIRGQRATRCKFCNTGYVDKLCDFPTGKHGKTCSAGMCAACATSIGPEIDYCPNHKSKLPQQGVLAL